MTIIKTANIQDPEADRVLNDIIVELDQLRQEIISLEGRAYIKYRTTDNPITVNDSLTTDDELSGWDIGSGILYRLEGYLKLDAASATPDFQCAFQFSAAAAASIVTYTSVNTGGAFDEVDTMQMTTAYNLSLATADRGVSLRGFFETHASNDGTLDFQWAQQTSSADDSTLFKGSWISITPVAKM